MKRLIALLLLCLGPPAFTQGDVTILRGTPAPPPLPPPAPELAPPQVIVVQPPAAVYPTYYYGLPYYAPPVRHHQRSTEGWPLFRR
jgi:hypothetical protein